MAMVIIVVSRDAVSSYWIAKMSKKQEMLLPMSINVLWSCKLASKPARQPTTVNLSVFSYLIDMHGGSRQDVVVGHGVLLFVDKVC